MAFAQITTSVSVLSSGLKGYQAISLTDFSTSALSNVAAGSCCEIAGAFFLAAEDITLNASSWTAITTATTAYLALTPSGTAGSQIVSASWVADAPVWSTSKQGYYATAASATRVVASVYKYSNTQQFQKIFFENNYDNNVSYKILPSEYVNESFSSPATTLTGITFDGTNLISCDQTTALIYVHNGISTTVASSFAAPGANPYSLTFDGTNLISTRINTALIYVHNGISTTVASSFASPGSNPLGLTFDGTNLISYDSGTGLIYKHNGVTSTVLSSFTPINTINDLAWDFVNNNLVSCNNTNDKIYIHDGFSSNILFSISTPATTIRAITFVKTYLISSDLTTDKIYLHNNQKINLIEW